MKKPTIEDLEDILSGNTKVDIEILPNGEIKQKQTTKSKEIFKKRDLVGDNY